MVILPTRARQEKAEKFMSQCATNGILVVDIDDIAPTPKEDWNILLSPSFGGGITRPLNYSFEKYSNEDHYIIGGDDLNPIYGWDEMLKEQCGPWDITYGPDGIQNENLPTHPCIGGALVRSVGWLGLPGGKHFYSDNAWLDIGRAIGTLKYVKEAKATHEIPNNINGMKDETWKRRGSSRMDKPVYEQWKATTLPKLINKIKKDREQYSL